MEGELRHEQDIGPSLRIALVAPPFLRIPPEGYGGLELVVADLARTLVERGHAVTLFAAGDSRLPGCRVEWLYPRAIWPPEPMADWNHAVFAAHRIAEERFDLVHAHSPAFVPLARSLHLPVVYTLHHARHAHGSRLQGDALARLYRDCPGLHYVCVSERQAELFDGVFASPPRVVPHGVDVTRYEPGDGGADDALFLGRLDAEKAPHLALLAAREAGMSLRIAGRPHDGDYFERVLAPLLAHGGGRLVGELRGQEKIRALGSARVLLFTSVWEEPFGLPLVEAMLCGTPVVALRRGAVPEIIDEGVTGFSVQEPEELADRVRDALGLDRRLVRARAMERFSRQRMTADYLALYEEALRLAPSERPMLRV